MLHILNVSRDLSQLLLEILCSQATCSKIVKQASLLACTQQRCRLLATHIPKALELDQLLVHQLLSDLLQAHNLILEVTDVVLESFYCALGACIVLFQILNSKKLLPLGKQALPFGHEHLLLLPYLLELSLVHLNLLRIEATFQGFLVLFNCVIAIEYLNLFLQLVQLLLNLDQDLLQLLLFAFCFVD